MLYPKERAQPCPDPVLLLRSILKIFGEVIAKPAIVLIAMIALVLVTVPANAGEIEPRAYVNTPVGVNFLLGGYVYSDGGLANPGSSPLKDAQLTTHTGILAYARSLDVLGKSAKVDAILSYSDLSGTAMVEGQPRERAVSGLNDPRFRFSINLYGAPALSLQEFPTYQQDLIIGASVQISPPLGHYDGDKLVNLGNNRWYVKPDIGISKAWGDFVLEFSTGMFFFTTNDDYFGGKTLEQNPLSTTQLHATYTIGRGVWVAVSGTYDFGGRTTVNGVASDDLQNNTRVGVTVTLPVNRNNSLKLYGNTGIATSRGTDFDLVGIVWQYRWGGGL